jgi:hypothetical protein
MGKSGAKIDMPNWFPMIAIRAWIDEDRVPAIAQSERTRVGVGMSRSRQIAVRPTVNAAPGRGDTPSRALASRRSDLIFARLGTSQRCAMPAAANTLGRVCRRDRAELSWGCATAESSAAPILLAGVPGHHGAGPRIRQQD